MSEPERIADQLLRSLHGIAWHGPSILEILEGVTTEEARQHPVASGHSIAELVLHVTAWMAQAERGLEGHPTELEGDADWPPVSDAFDWADAVNRLRAAGDSLAAHIRELSDPDLSMRVRGMSQEYSAYGLLHGVVQHNLYHAGQMALLKKALRGSTASR